MDRRRLESFERGGKSGNMESGRAGMVGNITEKDNRKGGVFGGEMETWGK